MAKIMDEAGGAGQARARSKPTPSERPPPPKTAPDSRRPGSRLIRRRARRHRRPARARRAPPRACRRRPRRRSSAPAISATTGGPIGRFIVSTDDAYVGADTSTVTSKIAGYVKAVPAPDNTRVKAGDPLVVLDDADYRIALDQRRGADRHRRRRRSPASASRSSPARRRSKSAEAQLASAKAAAENAEAQYDRVNALAGNGFATTSARDTARAARDQANQAVAAAEAARRRGARQCRPSLAAQKTEAERGLDQYRLARDQAQLNLDHTVIRAPFDGVVGNGAAQPGEFVQPGQRLLALVPLDAVYVDANFKETQLADLRPGQTVTVTVDAYPDLKIEGTVASIAPASGSEFSLLPPDNATGNFTKIVQRVPVRIRLPADVAAEGLIRPGMSVVAAVDTRTGGDPGRRAASARQHRERVHVHRRYRLRCRAGPRRRRPSRWSRPG